MVPFPSPKDTEHLEDQFADTCQQVVPMQLWHFLMHIVDWHVSVEGEVSYFKQNTCQAHMLE